MAPTTIRWGILATGGIAQTFAKDILVNPATRNVHTIRHTIVAAASSSGISRAQAFLNTVGATEAKAYGSYEDLAEDSNIDIIYVSTPHSHHYQNVKLCLEKGRNVLCEKTFTINATQARELVHLARDKNLFLMEAMWTRYLPVSIYIRETITSKRLGTIMRAYADNSLAIHPEETFNPTHRMVNPDLGGGALLDLGIYSINWIFQALYTTQPANRRIPPRVMSSMQKYSSTGIDESATLILTFPRDAEIGGDMHGIATTSFRVASDVDGKGTTGPAIRIQGSKGEMQVWPPIYRPTRTRLVLADGTVEERTWPQPGPGLGSGWYNGYLDVSYAEGEGYGMFWEADEAGMALVEGRKEGRYQGLDESVVIMDVVDEVRRQNGLRFPKDVEAAT